MGIESYEPEMGKLDELEILSLQVQKLNDLLNLIKRNKFNFFIFVRKKVFEDCATLPIYKDKNQNDNLPDYLNIFKKELIYYEDDPNKLKLCNEALNTNKLSKYDIYLSTTNRVKLQDGFEELESFSLRTHIQGILDSKIAKHIQKSYTDKLMRKKLIIMQREKLCSNVSAFQDEINEDEMLGKGYKKRGDYFYKRFPTNSILGNKFGHIVTTNKSKTAKNLIEHDMKKNVKIKKIENRPKLTDIFLTISYIDNTTFLNKYNQEILYEYPESNNIENLYGIQ